ncbi:bacteriohemerythrin [Anaerocolumna sp.]|uniref:bacteriohemerythrin n=1 Tax=Anaerocolumna sp. TaxID=2041569 RepID=UPI0028ACD80A|nr:hemerythrin family protein [Anaerocolumna sp.]
MFVMKEEYYTGIKQIDEEHKELFRIAQSAYDVFADEFIPDKFDHIVTIINELKEYAKFHFASEEAYMKKIGYKKLFSQVVDHEQFMEKVNGIDFEQVDKNQTEMLLDILTFIGDWLSQHILEKDKLISEN